MSDNTTFIVNLATGDGVVATSPAQITAGVANHARRMDVTFCNFGSNEETVTLFISRNGGPLRQWRQFVLETNESAEIGGLPLNLGDSLQAQTTDANAVSYWVAIAAQQSVLSFRVYDSKGGIKTAPYILEQLDAITGQP